MNAVLAIAVIALWAGLIAAGAAGGLLFGLLAFGAGCAVFLLLSVLRPVNRR